MKPAAQAPPAQMSRKRDDREREPRGDAQPEVGEADRPGRRRTHPATAPNRRSRAPKPRTSAANISAVKSGQRVSTKANSA